MFRARGLSIARSWKIWAAGVFILLVAFLYPASDNGYDPRALLSTGGALSRQWLHGDGTNLATFTSDSTHPQPNTPEAHAFWNDFAKILVAGNLTFPIVRQKENLTTWPMIDFRSIGWWSQREDRMNMTDAEVDEMKEKHAYVKGRLEEIAPMLPFVKGTRGIVMTTSVEAMAYFTVSVRMLRKTGTTLPLEIWIYDRDVFGITPHGLRMCEEVWSKLGATCKFVEDYLPDPKPVPLDKEPVHYEHKLTALLFSSFEQALFFDADDFPIMPIDDLFVQEPFISKGLVLWPDYWADTSSPYYYKIAGIEQDGYLEHATTESGQIMVNKDSHAKALLLAAYYARYGKLHYYRLFTQGGVGEGDKECYYKAAQAYGMPSYQIKERPQRMGYRCDGDEKPLASAQHHPADDYFLVSQHLRRDGYFDTLNSGTPPRICFIHANMPKLEPRQYLDWGDASWPNQHRCHDGEPLHRMYGPKRLVQLKFGWDVEKAMWDQMRWVACELESYMVQWFNGTDYNKWTPRPNICRDMEIFYDELLVTQEGLKYDPSLDSPYRRNGEFESFLQSQTNDYGSWETVRSNWRWWLVDRNQPAAKKKM